MNYELMLVATVDKGDSLVSRVEKAIKEAEIKDLKVDQLGKKVLAYPIKKNEYANYYVLKFEAEANTLKSLTDKLRLEQEDLLRYLLLKNVEKKVKSKKRKVVENEEKIEKVKPKVIVAVKQSSAVKSKGNKSIGTKGTRSTKGKSK